MTETQHGNIDSATEHKRRNWFIGLGAAAVVVAIAAVFAVTVIASGGAGGTGGSPASVIEDFYRAFPDDVEGAAAVFAEDAVLTGAPTPPSKREGIVEITEWLQDTAAVLTSAEITRIEVSGNTVTWDDTVRIASATGHVAVVEDGKIVTWDFGR